MASKPATQPVRDTVPKINDELAIGEDLRFQERWWRFENGVWIFFALLIVMDLAGVFGRGPLAQAQTATRDGDLHVKYERVERFGTPSIMDVLLGPGTVQNGKTHLWVSNELVKVLGNQRVIPQPAESRIEQNGVLYTFAAAPAQLSVAFALEPAEIGLHTLRMRVPGADWVDLKIFVVP